MTLTLVKEDNPQENKFPDNKEIMIVAETNLMIIVTTEIKVMENMMGDMMVSMTIKNLTVIIIDKDKVHYLRQKNEIE